MKQITTFLFTLFLFMIPIDKIIADGYCIPPFWNGTGTNDTFCGITRVVLNGSPRIDKQTSYLDKYQDFTSMTASVLDRGVEYTIEIGLHVSSPYISNNAVWIDWNQDFDFDDEGEKVVTYDYATESFTETFKVPAYAKEGVTRMRVYNGMTGYTNIYPEPCGYLNHTDKKGGHLGNVEDYNVSITGEYFGKPEINIGNEFLDYDEVGIGDFKVDTVEIKNAGDADLEVYNLIISNNGDEAFLVLEENFPVTVEGGKTYYAEVKFTPQKEHYYDRTLSVYSNDEKNAQYDMFCSGIGIVTNVQVNANLENLDFGKVNSDENKEMEVRIENSSSSDSDLLIREISFSKSIEEIFNISELEFPIRISPGLSRDIKVSFVPTETGEYSGQMSIVTNASVNKTLTIDIAAVSTNPEANIQLSNLEFDFEGVPVNQNKEIPITLTNSPSTVNLKITEINIEDENKSVFTIVSPELPLILEPDASGEIVVLFSPDELVNYQGTLSIVSNAVNGESQIVSLSGEGLEAVSVKDGKSVNEKYEINVYPNPVNSESKMEYAIKETSEIELFVIDRLGNRVLDLYSGHRMPGSYSLNIDIKTLNSGTYFVVIQSNDYSLSHPIIMSK